MPDRRLARAEEHDPLRANVAAGDAQRREQARQRDRGRALDVVVEHADAVAVLREQPERVLVGEVLELDQHAGQELAAPPSTNSSTSAS